MLYTWVAVSCLAAAVSAGQLTSRTKPLCSSGSACGTHVIRVDRATNGSDSIIYLWGDIGVPAISVMRNKTSDEDWSWEDVNYIQTTLFTRLIAFNTTDYTPGVGVYFECSLADQTWVLDANTSKNTNATHVSEVMANLTLIPDNSSSPCDFSILFATSDSEGREEKLPHLKYSENSTRVELQFKNFNLTNDAGEDLSMTLGLNFVLESIIIPDATAKKLTPTSGRSLDDEYTPSQFWHSQIENGEDKGFHYWKPIVYTDANSRNIKNSVPVDTQKVGGKGPLLTLEEAGFNDTDIPYSIANWTGLPINRADVRVLYLSFNATQSSQQVFNVVIGVGEVPSDSISWTVILIIALGLGLPTVVLVFGVPAVTIYRRVKRSSRDGYAPIQ